jgi:hypothetical protein
VENDEESIRMPDSAEQISAMYEVPTFDENEAEDSSFDPSSLPPPQ